MLDVKINKNRPAKIILTLAL